MENFPHGRTPEDEDYDYRIVNVFIRCPKRQQKYKKMGLKLTQFCFSR